MHEPQTAKQASAWIISITRRCRFLADDECRMLGQLLDRHHPEGRALTQGLQLARVQLDAKGARVLLVLNDNGGRQVNHKRLGETPNIVLASACRYAVRDVTRQQREGVAWGHIKCPVTGWTLHHDATDVDHVHPWPFEAIVDAWLAANHYTAETLIARGFVGHLSSAEEDSSCFADFDISNSFLIFHNERAKLRLVHSYANRYVLTGATTKASKQLAGFFRLPNAKP